MSRQKQKNIFIQGAVSPSLIADMIAKHSDKTGIGAHSIFLGQVRADKMETGSVVSIEYTAYEEMALEQIYKIREELIAKFQLNCLHVFHSLGVVSKGEICLFVLTSAPHRKAAIDACSELVELIKKDLPIWGREILHNQSFEWKENK